MPTSVQIAVVVQSKLRQVAELWKGTTITNESFYLTTNLDTYRVDLVAVGTVVFNFVQSERARYAYCNLQCSITMENTSHPTPAKGVVILPKGYREFQLTDEEFLSPAVLSDALILRVTDLKNVAKY